MPPAPPTAPPSVPPAPARAVAPARARAGVRALLALLVVAVVAPFVVLTVVRGRQRAADAQHAAEERALEVARMVAARTEDRANSLFGTLAALSRAVRTDAAGTAANDSLMLAVKRELDDPYLTNLWVLDLEGYSIGTSRRPIPPRNAVPTADRRYFQDVLRTHRPSVGDPVRARPDTTVWSVAFAYPVLDAGGTLRAVLIGTQLLVPLERSLATLDLPAGSVATIVDARGVVLARSRDSKRWVGYDTGELPALRAALQRGHGVLETAGLDGVRRLTAIAPVPRVGWRAYVGIPYDTAFAAVADEVRREILLGMATLLFALLVAARIARRIVQPIETLAGDARALAAGDYTRRSSADVPRELAALAGTFNEMAATIAARTAELHRSEQRWRLLFDASPLPMYVADLRTYRILAVNDAAVAQYGWSREEFLARTMLDMRPPHERLKFLAVARSLEEVQLLNDRTNAGVWTHLRRDGASFEVEVFTARTEYEGTPARLTVAVDVTARRLAERALQESQEQLRRSQKMEALGRFAGGIAHDFNNLLTGILGYCDLALADLPDDSPVREDFTEIRTAAQRAAGLTGQILAFSRGQVVQPVALDVAEVMAGLEPMLRRVIGEHIHLAVRRASGGGAVLADRGQLEQVIMNLTLNARDAMPDGGMVTVATQPVDVDVDDARHPGVRPGRWLLLEVQDTGVGMDAETQARIFEPFFTTKERGKGTGLGLSTVYGIVRQCGGVVRVRSAPDEGSTFSVYLPRIEAPAPTDVAAALPRAAAAPKRGTETILLAEDENAVRAIAREALTRRGYRVLVAADGPTAIDVARRWSGEIDLLLTDVVMPGMSGRELAEVLCAQRPGMRVLFSSGYTEDEVLHRGVSADAVAFLAKPFTPDTLAERVRAVLDADPAVAPAADAAAPPVERPALDGATA